nr:MAG TPA: Terminase small subunit [Caudoviricetes sp.]
MVVSSKGKSSKELNKKELMFCHYYINTGDSKEAAVRAGYKTFPNKKGTELLLDKRISERIESMYREKRKNLVYRATSGYERLAFGSISDSIKLLFSENLRPEDLEKMDLFNISEIKKPKDGAMEIKFFDRLRALEKLEQIDVSMNDTKEPFYYALEEGMKKLSNSKNDPLED